MKKKMKIEIRKNFLSMQQWNKLTGENLSLINEMIPEESGWRPVKGIEVNHAYAARLDLVTFPVRIHGVKHYLAFNNLISY